MFDSINKHVLKLIDLSEEEITIFNSLLEFRKVPKKTMLLHEGNICTFEAFINTRFLSKDFYELQIVGYKKITLYLIKNSSNKYFVYATINNRQIMLSRIFLKINGGTFLSPNVEYVEFKGTHLTTGLDVTEKVKI